MTKKDYQLIADCIREAKQEDLFGDCDQRDAQLSVLSSLMFRVSHRLEDENPRFDKAKFIDACQL